MEQYRIEKDGLGEIEVPESAYYGAGTMRAVNNFIDSGLRLPPGFIQALALIKKHAAEVNHQLGLLPDEIAGAVSRAARETQEGQFRDHFVVDVFQTGSGTSTNMNMNEVLASRANEILTGKRGGKSPVHPNDHVNLGQSSNDVIPSAIHLAALNAVQHDLQPSLFILWENLDEKASEFQDVKKIGRTHLQDAVPITLGQEFSGYAQQIDWGLERIERLGSPLKELALGGTAVGNGLNTHPDFASQIILALSRETDLGLRVASNHFMAQATQDAAVEASGVLKTLAVSLVKIANDIRWLASGPRCGLGEINLPALQPGSSIMPGKVNPVIPESVLQISAQVVGNDAAITLGGQGGYFELNLMLPVIGYNLLQSIDLLASGAENFALKCIKGITANKEKCAENIEKSLALATYLVPRLGYDRATAVAKKAQASAKNVLDIVREEGLLTEEEIAALYDEM